jgi:acyl-CoA oxidase
MNYVQDRFANQTEQDHAEVVRLCCIIKPMVTWHGENTASVCRERCGGQGFLAANRFGEGICGSHAGITAEGDNRVIQQKVSKELLDSVDPQQVGIHLKLRQKTLAEQHSSNHLSTNDVTSTEWLLKLFARREQFQLNELAGSMFLATKQQKKSIFDAWMLEQSDNVQALATSYGEQIAVQQFDKAIRERAHPEIKDTLRNLFTLYALDRVHSDGVFFLQNGIINAEQSAQINREIQRLCNELGRDALDLTAAFGIPDHMHHAPIANNWVVFNSNDSQGELANQDYRKSKL